MTVVPREMSITTVQRLARRVSELSTALSTVRIMHSANKDGVCDLCGIAECPTWVAAQDPRPLRRRPWLPLPRGNAE